MSLWSDYQATLKSVDVEEPVDLWLHRPAAFVLVLMLMPTPISPNVVTLASIAAGFCAAFAVVSDFSGHMPLAGALVFLSAVFDCADGQLARRRGTSSRFGRMLDGSADLIVSMALVIATAVLMWRRHGDDWQSGVVMGTVLRLTAVSCSHHTFLYDHYKNIYLRFTSESFGDNDQYDAACLRYEKENSNMDLVSRVAGFLYLVHLGGQKSALRLYDRETTTQLMNLPAYSEANAEIYRRHALPVLRHWRSGFGFGSLVFSIALALGFDAVGYLVVLRLGIYNLYLHMYLAPKQRRASRAAFDELGLSVEELENAPTPQPS